MDNIQFLIIKKKSLFNSHSTNHTGRKLIVLFNQIDASHIDEENYKIETSTKLTKINPLLQKELVL